MSQELQREVEPNKIDQEVKMVDEQAVMSEPEQPENSETEALPEPTSGVIPAETDLAAEIKERLLACTEDSACLIALSSRFEHMAKALGTTSDKLIDDVFTLLTDK
jgi:hypothetical protein